ncbi:MAG: S-layer homology domain-containing protein [Bacillota bacterium]
MTNYGIVRGDEKGNLNLDKPITRAEMITIMVRATGREEEASYFTGVKYFEDVDGHWAEGYINYAAASKLVKGDGNGFVRPQDSISWAEALTLIVRAVGLEPTTGDWPVNVVVAASELGIVPPGVTLANVRQPAIRGQVFTSLAQAVTTVKTPEGRTYLQDNIDKQPPVISLKAVADTTKDASVVISGSVNETASVKVNGKAVTLAGLSFNGSADLEYGENVITVEAVDLAGNAAKKELKVTRLHPISALQINGPANVPPGATVTYAVTAQDNSGKDTGLTGVTAKVEGNIGTFDLATGKFTATNTPNVKGKIVVSTATLSESFNVEIMGPSANAYRLGIRHINNGLAVPYTRPMTVQVEVRDQMGQLLTEDYGRPVSLVVSGVAGLTVSPQVAKTVAGVATFTVNSPGMGMISLTANSDNLYSDLRTAVFGSNLRVRLTADPTTVMVGGTNNFSNIHATLVNEDSVPVANTLGQDIYVTLVYSGSQGSLTQSFLRIPIGSSSSLYSGGLAGRFTAGPLGGTAVVTGNITSGQNLTVDPVTITTTVPTIGAGSYWDLLGNKSQQQNVQDSFMIRLSSQAGATIPGAYSFQLQVETSNGETKTNGIPAGVELWIGDTSITNTNTIFRTSSGTALIKVRYNKPGEVKLSIISATTTTSALGTDGLLGASSAPGVPTNTFTLQYAGTFANVRVVADSEAFGNGKAVGATAINSSKTVTLTAMATDGTYWVPALVGTAELLKDGGTSFVMPSASTVTFSNGKVTFTLSPTSTAGGDTYRIRMTIGSTTYTSPQINVYAQSAAPVSPTILAVRGTNNGVPGALDYVAPEDTGMEIELAQDTAQKWVVVRVYAENQYSPLFTSDPIDLSTVAPRITVPKSALPTGVYRYQVTVRNGYAESARSGSSNQVTNSVYVTNVVMSSGKYQWSTRYLTIYGSGFSSSDSINPALISIQNGATTRSLTGSQIVSISSGQIVLNLTNATYLADIESASLFRGKDVRLTGSGGWLTRTNGEKASAVTNTVPVSPMAHITHTEYDHVNGRLFIVGSGFDRVAIDFSKLVLQATSKPDLSLNGLSNTRLSDNRWQVNLSSTIISNLNSDGAYALNAADGWAYDSSFTQLAVSSVPIRAMISLSSVTYDSATSTVTITGSGFSGGSVTVGNLSALNLANSVERTLAGEVTIVSDTQINIVLSPDALAVSTDFYGSEVYLLGATGWFTNSVGRTAAAIPVRSLRFPTFPTP